MKQFRKLSWINRIILLAVVLVGLTNPWSVGYIGAGVDTAVVYFTLYANYVFIASLIALGLVNIWQAWRTREKVNYKPKSAKTQKYLET